MIDLVQQIRWPIILLIDHLLARPLLTMVSDNLLRRCIAVSKDSPIVEKAQGLVTKLSLSHLIKQSTSRIENPISR